MFEHLPYVVEPMSLEDLDQVMEIEQASFSSPWSARAYRFEIAENNNSTMLVSRQAPPSAGWFRPLTRLVRTIKPNPTWAHPPVLGYAGCWYLVDEMHICTIAVHPEWRRRGVGELLLVSLLEKGARRSAHRATLEVRVSNAAAQGLYRKYGFEVVSRQRHYYSDNNEDAYIMATPRFETGLFQENMRRRRVELYARLGARRSS